MKRVEKQPVEVSGSKRTIRAIGIAALAAIVVLIVSYGAMTIGYILVVVALSVFFLIVAFDVGVPKQSSDSTDG
jgi:heme O synthase-like polyprenyltransferase